MLVGAVPHPGVCGWFIPRPREGGTDAAMGDGDESLSLSLVRTRYKSGDDASRAHGNVPGHAALTLALKFAQSLRASTHA